MGPDIPSGYASGVCGIESGECWAECDAAAEGREPQVEDETNEDRKPRRMADPMRPTRREIEEHEITHIPYRNWCWACVQGRGKATPHRRSKESGSIPELHLDFMFLGPKDEPGGTIPCLVVKETSSKVCMATMVPSKSVDQFVVKRVVAFLTEVGCLHGDVIVKSDENAIKCVVEEVGKHRAAAGGGKWIVEHSPVGASASNGSVERAIQSVEAQVRVLKLALEHRYKVELPAKHAMIPWMIEYAAFLLNRFEVGHDGKTA